MLFLALVVNEWVGLGWKVDGLGCKFGQGLSIIKGNGWESVFVANGDGAIEGEDTTH